MERRQSEGESGSELGAPVQPQDAVVKRWRAAFGYIRNCQQTYSIDMALASPIEDHRGVDVAQIRALLAMSPAERLDHMLEVARRLRAFADHAQRARQ